MFKPHVDYNMVTIVTPHSQRGEFEAVKMAAKSHDLNMKLGMWDKVYTIHQSA